MITQYAGEEIDNMCRNSNEAHAKLVRVALGQSRYQRSRGVPHRPSNLLPELLPNLQMPSLAEAHVDRALLKVVRLIPLTSIFPTTAATVGHWGGGGGGVRGSPNGTYVHINTNTYTPTRIRIYIHASVHACVKVYMHAYTHATYRVSILKCLCR